MSYGYGGRENPYDQRGAAAPQGGYNAQPYGGAAPAYGRQQYNAPAMGRDEYTGQNVEMEPLTGNSGQYGYQNDPNKILNDCRDIDNGIRDIAKNLEELKKAQGYSLQSANPDNQRIDALSTETMAMYRSLVARVKTIKSQPESGSPRNAQQIGKVDRDLKRAIQDFQKQDSEYRKKLQDQMARQYRIVRPEASESEVREAVEDPSGGQQVFANALMQSDRRGEARTVMSAVQSRHAEIQKIESQMIELAQLFEDMNAMVIQQEEAVTNIEMKGEEVVTNLDEGTKQIGTAIKSARNARKWKWWCCGISVLIVLIIVIIIVAWCFTAGPCKANNNKKRWLLDISEPASLAARSLNEARHVIPGLDWTPEGALAPAKNKRECFFTA